MYPNMPQSLVWDHLRESRQQAAVDRRANAARHSAHVSRQDRRRASRPRQHA
jgi:hypothetical protein